MFEQCKDKSEIKSLFRKLAKYLHPDVGGDSYLMNRLQESKEYHELKLALDTEINREEQKKSRRGYEKVYEDVHVDDWEFTIIDEIYSYALKNKSFSTQWIDSIYEYYEIKGYITSAQYNTLVKCYYSFNMHEK